ncbi:MAG: bifunctional diaminohydroxyphosphoribosylaminopyrimidine deaminase/5-amino-6-(5-phosphoribosylamino)uracil reductase RibD [Candidatus Kapaibacterium sp.]
MKECLKLAEKGRGNVEPNPMVGCVIVKEGKIVGRGYHKKFGSHHAEVNAVNNARKKTQDIKGSTLYVNLEPCSHFGKTPPCTELIIKNKIKRVVVGMKDPNQQVNGKGIAKLQKASIEVKTGILKDECLNLNERFSVNVTKRRPFVTLKIAQSIDGIIALNNYKSQWITDIYSRQLTHSIRSNNDCILIGKNSVIQDNPELTVRLVKTSKKPVRIVIDKDLKLSNKYKLLKNNPPLTIIYHSSNKKTLDLEYLKYMKLKSRKGQIKIADILNNLYFLGYNSLLVEGGAYVFSQFVNENLFDEIYLFIAPKIIGNGISSFRDYKINRLADAKEIVLKEIKILDKDLLLIYKNIK